MIDRIIAKVRAITGSGPWHMRAIKTALSHGAVVALTTGAGIVVGIASIYLLGLHPFFAFAFPLTGAYLGFDFYARRELRGPKPDIAKEGWRAKVDSALDFIVPALVTHALIYGTVLLYGLLGAG